MGATHDETAGKHWVRPPRVSRAAPPRPKHSRVRGPWVGGVGGALLGLPRWGRRGHRVLPPCGRTGVSCTPPPALSPPRPSNNSRLPPRRRCCFARPIGNPQEGLLETTGVAEWLSRRPTRRAPPPPYGHLSMLLGEYDQKGRAGQGWIFWLRTNAQPINHQFPCYLSRVPRWE